MSSSKAGDDQESRWNGLNAATMAQSPTPDILAPHVAGVKAASDRRIGRALDDGSTIAEQSQLVWFGPKLQYEIIVTNGPVRLEPSAHFHKVDRSMQLVDLHGVPSAKRDVRPAFTGEMDKLVLAAGATSGARVSGSNFGAFIAP